MEVEAVEKDSPMQNPERNESAVKTISQRNQEPENQNQGYKDTEYAIGGCNKFGLSLSDADRYANPPPQYEMTYDERDRYLEYLQQTDDQCIQKQHHRISAYRYVTERNKPHASKVRVYPEPAFISTETQTYEDEDLTRYCNRNTCEVIHQRGEQPTMIKQYGGRIFRQPMDICGFNRNRPPIGTNKLGFWKEITDQRNCEGIPISSYGEGLRAQEPYINTQDQRYDTEVKRIDGTGTMTSYSEPHHTYMQADSVQQDLRYIERRNTNISDGRIRNTSDGHQLPVAGPRQQVHNHMNRQNTDIDIDDRNTNTRDRHQLPVQQVEDWIQMDAPNIQRNTVHRIGRNDNLPNHESQQELLNTAMMEPRLTSRNSKINAADQEWFDRRTPHTNNSESLPEQKMNLMQEMFQMVSVQNAHMRDQINTKISCELYPRSSLALLLSTRSWLNSNCCEISHWRNMTNYLCSGVH